MSLKPSFPNHTVEELKSMDPLELYTLQIRRSNSMESRLSAVRRTRLVGEAIGSSRLHKELIPLLIKKFLNTGEEGEGEEEKEEEKEEDKEEEDEMLLNISTQLGLMSSMILSANNLKSIKRVFQLLEKLCCTEETVVRSAAVKSFTTLIEDMKDTSVISNLAVPILQRMVSSEWFPSKVSSGGILPAVLKGLGGDSQYESRRSECHSFYRTLSNDESPMVRRAAAKNLKDYLAATSQISSEHLDIVKHLSRDEVDNIRLLAVNAVQELIHSRNIGIACKAVADEMMSAAVSDQSWRVRDSAANVFGSDNMPGAEYLDAYTKLLNDIEAEVRASAVNHFAKVAQTLSDSQINSLMGVLTQLAEDGIIEVRKNLAGALVTSKVSDKVMIHNFSKILEVLVEDEFPEVQLAILTKLHLLSHLLPKLDGLVQRTLTLAKSQTWRLRESLCLLTAHLTGELGQTFYEEHLSQIFLDFITDPVSSVRQSAVKSCETLAKLPWTTEVILPQLQKRYQTKIASDNYLFRLTLLRCFAAFAITGHNPGLYQVFLRSLSEDPVANVRMMAARSLGMLLHDHATESSKNFDPAAVETALHSRMALDDEDDDCKLACEMALAHEVQPHNFYAY